MENQLIIENKEFIKVKIRFIILTILLGIFLWSCSSKKTTLHSEATRVTQEAQVISESNNTQVALINDSEIGYGLKDLMDENSVELPNFDFNAGAPATVGNWERSFENAPPMIPHTLAGFVPIKAGVNACLACHLPMVAAALKATAMPKSHFTDYRPKLVEENGMIRVDAEEGEVVAMDLGAVYNSARYNCTQCHAPQANTTVLIQNEFNPFFRAEADRKKTNLSENIGEGVK